MIRQVGGKFQLQLIDADLTGPAGGKGPRPYATLGDLLADCGLKAGERARLKRELAKLRPVL